MDSMRSLNTSLPGSSGQKQTAQNDSPEQLLDAFKAAALSVTKLYKTSAASQAKARLDGYQDCLNDLLAFLDKGNLGVGDGEGWRVRKWATERLDGRDSPSQTAESEDEDLTRTASGNPQSTMREDSQTQIEPTPPTASPALVDNAQVTVPSQDSFTFQSSHPYPQDAYLNIANLDLSDSRGHDSLPSHVTSTTTTNAPTNRASRLRHTGVGARLGARQANQLGRGAGSKRKINLGEIFDLGSLGHDKNMFGGGSKRSRHS
ncbi:hypothetical protein HYQ44_000586 [Verticillium longisporum]|nr:hypothetical protein HYQ44_000586 [Verticillium longisporum]